MESYNIAGKVFRQIFVTGLAALALSACNLFPKDPVVFTSIPLEEVKSGGYYLDYSEVSNPKNLPLDFLVKVTAEDFRSPPWLIPLSADSEGTVSGLAPYVTVNTAYDVEKDAYSNGEKVGEQDYTITVMP